MNNFERASLALRKISPYIHRTPLEYSALLSKLSGAQVFLKLENHQVTGSFKARGALNRVFSLTDSEKKAGVVTASSGNHGAAVSYALSKAKSKGLVFVPENADPSKVENIKLWGAEVKFHGTDSGVCEPLAREYGEKHGLTYISPYNDEIVVDGQATIGVEILEQRATPLDAIVISVGGGGLIAGIARVLKEKWPGISVIGTSPENSCDMVRSIREKRPVNYPSKDTLSDGTAGTIELTTITFEPCVQTVDDTDLPTEKEIAEAMRLLVGKHHLLVEGSAALPVATLLRKKDELKGKSVCLVLCGANVSAKTLKEVL